MAAFVERLGSVRVDDARAEPADVRVAEVDSAPLGTDQPDTATVPRLAEPPIPGGRVEAAMGALIRVLSHSPLARPLPAVILSALGLGGVAFVGLCATAPVASAATPPVLLPLTSVARDLGAPHLPDAIADTVMYASIGLCCLGLAMMLWANSRGWSPRPRRVFAVAAGAVAVLVNITPVGSSDAASYAAYGRIAALGYNTIRIPFSNQMVEAPIVPQNIAFTNNSGPINTDLKGLNAVQDLQKIVTAAGQAGLKVILDDHRSEAGESAEQDGLWYTSTYTSQDWINDWTTLGKMFAGNPTVIGFDLRNEPHTPAGDTYAQGATWGANAAQQAYITYRQPVRVALLATALLG